MTSAPGSLCDVLHSVAGTGKGITFLSGGDESRISYRQLLQDALSLAEGMRDFGVREGDEIMIQCSHPASFLRWFWGSLLGGFVAVPIEVRRSPDHVAKAFRVWRKLGRKWLVADRTAWEGLAAHGMQHGMNKELKEMESRRLSAVVSDGPCKSLPAASGTSSRAFIQFSSGTTGEPKGVVLNHQNIMSNILGILERVRYSEEDRSLSWLPLTHDMGLIGFHLAPMAAGMEQFLMLPEGFIRSPLTWVEYLSEHRIQYSVCPNFGMRHVLQRFRSPKTGHVDLSHVKLIFNGAEQISPSLCRAFSDALAPFGLRRECLFNVYGLAEASLAVTFPPLGEKFRTVKVNRRGMEVGKPLAISPEDDAEALELAELGMPFKDSPIRIAASDGAIADEDVLGTVQIRGANVTEGYYKTPHEVEPACNPDGWMDTGDLGFVHRGRLIITGRLKDIICANGRNLLCHDLETAAMEIPGLEASRTAAVGVPGFGMGGEEVALFLETKSRDWAELAKLALDLKTSLLSRLSVDLAWVVPVPSLPRTTSGKIQRYRLRQDFLDGAFLDRIASLAEAGFLGAGGQRRIPAKETLESASDAPSVPGADEVKARFLKAVSQALRIDPTLVDTSCSLLQLGFDSMMAANLNHLAESEFGLKLEISLFFEARPLTEILEIIAAMPRYSPRTASPGVVEMEI